MTFDVLASVREAVIETDLEFRITRWNRGAERIFGWTADEVVGRHAWDVLKTDLTDSERARQIVELRDHGHVLAIVTQRTRDGDPVEVESSVLAVEDGGNGRVG